MGLPPLIRLQQRIYGLLPAILYAGAAGICWKNHCHLWPFEVAVDPDRL